jgi:hypothetical protein
VTYCPRMTPNSQDIEKSCEVEFPQKLKKRRSAQNGADRDRRKFWIYCQRAAAMADHRCRGKGVPVEIDAYFVDQLLVDQRWRCAVSGIQLKPPFSATSKHHRDPFGPSLDRIVPARGYVKGNLRIVSNIVNSAMNEWGLDALLVLLKAMTET